MTLSAWLGQRSRWMKGWMQTLAVFLRTPRAQIRKMGFLPTFAAVCAMASLLAGPLFGPLYSLRLGHDLLLRRPAQPEGLGKSIVVSGFSLSVGFFGAAGLCPAQCDRHAAPRT